MLSFKQEDKDQKSIVIIIIIMETHKKISSGLGYTFENSPNNEESES